MAMTGPIPRPYSHRAARRPLAVTLTGWQLGVSSSAFLVMAVATVVAWAVHR